MAATGVSVDVGRAAVAGGLVGPGVLIGVGSAGIVAATATWLTAVSPICSTTLLEIQPSVASGRRTRYQEPSPLRARTTAVSPLFNDATESKELPGPLRRAAVLAVIRSCGRGVDVGRVVLVGDGTAVLVGGGFVGVLGLVAVGTAVFVLDSSAVGGSGVEMSAISDRVSVSVEAGKRRERLRRPQHRTMKALAPTMILFRRVRLRNMITP